MNNRRKLELLYEQRARACRASLYTFLREFWGVVETESFVDNWHIRYLCDRVQEVIGRVVRGELWTEPRPPVLVVNIPPGMSKSTIITQMAPAWAWTVAPWLSICVSTSSQALSDKNSRKSKMIVRSERYRRYFDPFFIRKFGAPLTLTKDLDRLWVNNFKGERHFRSVTGTITGDHFHLKLIDDPLDAFAARSKKVREQANRHVFEVLPSRSKDPRSTPTILVMQRLHHDDPAGRYIEMGCDLVKLPATDDGDVQPPELRSYYRDGLFCPERLSRAALEEKRRLLGELNFTLQYMQDASARGGTVIHGRNFPAIPADRLPDGENEMWVDAAYTENEDNDPTGILITRYDPASATLYVVYACSVREELPGLIRKLKALQGEWLSGSSRTYIEPKASGLSVKQMLRKSALNPVPIRGRLVQEGKEARANIIALHSECGRIVLVEGAWNKAYIDQLEAFPNGKHDEYIDLTGYAAHKYLKHFGLTDKENEEEND